jgi:hypothetical protein
MANVQQECPHCRPKTPTELLAQRVDIFKMAESLLERYEEKTPSEIIGLAWFLSGDDD